MANRFRLWFSRHGMRTIVTIIILFACYKYINELDEYYRIERENEKANTSNTANSSINETETNIL